MRHDASVHAPPLVYLDMNIWVGLARGLKDGSGPWCDAAYELRDARQAGRITMPLSGEHYRELWLRGSEDSRLRVGTLMRDLSGYASLSPMHVIRRAEIDAYIARWFRDDTRWVDGEDVLGYGVNHAFAWPHGRLRFVESLQSVGVPEGPPSAPPEGLDEVVGTPAWEWFSLVGHQEWLNGDGLDRSPTHRDGDDWVERELELRRSLTAIPQMRRRLWDLIVVEEIQTMTDELNEACLAASVDPYGLFFSPPAADPPSAMRGLVAGLPTVNVFATLRHEKHRDVNHAWEQHDLSDLITLATAVPYCDAVVTEKRWAHMVEASGLGSTYGTLVGAGIKGLRAVLDMVAGPLGRTAAGHRVPPRH